jgi:hypothetical protein
VALLDGSTKLLLMHSELVGSSAPAVPLGSPRGLNPSLERWTFSLNRSTALRDVEDSLKSTGTSRCNPSLSTASGPVVVAVSPRVRPL